jgi:hypothetical protein
MITEYKQSFDDFIYYLDNSDREKLQQGMEKAPAYPALSEKVLSGQWNELVNYNPIAFAFQATRSFKEGNLSAMCLCTGLTFTELWNHPGNVVPGKRIVSIFPDGNLDELARRMINATMKVASAALIEYRTFLRSLGILKDKLEFPQPSEEKVWNEKQEIEFFNGLSTRFPPSEHYFLILPDAEFNVNYMSSGERMSFDLGFNAFSRLYLSKKRVRMIPSRGMIQAFIEVLFPNTAVQPVYRLAVSTLQVLFDTFKERQARDFFQSFAPFSHLTPSHADGNRTDQRFGEFAMHDFYHQALVSNIPLQERQLYFAFIECIQTYAESHKENPFFTKFAEELMDMELPYYKHTQPNALFHRIFYGKTSRPLQLTLQEQFWISIGGVYVRCQEKLKLRITEHDQPFFNHLADWLIGNHLTLSSIHPEILEPLSNEKDPSFKDGFFNFYEILKFNFLLPKLNQRLVDICEKGYEALLEIVDHPGVSFVHKFFRNKLAEYYRETSFSNPMRLTSSSK